MCPTGLEPHASLGLRKPTIAIFKHDGKPCIKMVIIDESPWFPTMPRGGLEIGKLRTTKKFNAAHGHAQSGRGLKIGQIQC